MSNVLADFILNRTEVDLHMITSKDRAIRVANIIEEAKLGGPQVRIARLSEHDDVETTVVMPNNNSEDFRHLLKQKNIKFHTLYLTRITKEPLAAIQYILFSFFEIFSLYMFFKKEAFDIVHASGGAWQYKGVIAGKLAGCKVIWHLNDTALPRVFRWIFRQLSIIPDYYIFASNRTKSYYLPLIRKKSTPYGLVRQPVNTKMFCPEVESKSWSDPHNSKSDLITIGTVANINPIKGLELFILVASNLNKFFENLRFIIVGPVHNSQKKYFEELQTYATGLDVKNLVFFGKSSNVKKNLSSFDVFLCTSVNESGPLTLWEAMSMQKAIVTTDVGDVREHLSLGISGDIVEVGDVNDMTSKVAALVSDSAKRERYGKEARKVILEKFDTQLCAMSQLSIYREVAAFQNGNST